MNDELSPIEAPHTYPGQIVTNHCTITHDSVRPFTVPESGRIRVLAIGSNGSPGQLRRKFRNLGRWEVPVIMVDIHGLEVAHSAHVAKYGSIPWAPVRHARTIGSRRFPLLWLTDEQLQVMDETEPNYTRMVLPETHRIDAAVYGSSVDLCSGGHHDDIWMYRSRHGVIGDHIGNPIPASDQETIVAGILAPRIENVDYEGLAHDDDMRQKAAAVLQTMAVPDGF